MNLVVIDTGQKKFLQKCLDSLAETLEIRGLKAQIVRERKSREETLNSIFKKYGADDLLVFGDDIIFTKGWFEFLTANKDKGDIIGFSMLYPETDKIQDRGYDLARIDEEIVLKPRSRGRKKDALEKFDFRECDSLNGCALFIKKRVIKEIPRVTLEGMNRWGEFLYLNEAKKKGFKVIVLGHHLYHYGKGTKINPNKLLSSESYLLERDIWKNIVDKYINRNQIKIEIERVLSGGLKNALLSNKKILLYGAGRVPEFICKKLDNDLDLKFIDFCSGLKEEEGRNFCGKKVKFYKNTQFKDYGMIIITVLEKEKEIFSLIKDYIKGQKIYYITQETADNRIKFNIKKLNF